MTWRKTLWWVFLVGLLSFFVWSNSNRIFSQDLIPIDYLFIIILLLLLILPLASEVDFLGFSIKKEIQSLKTEIKGDLITLRSEIHNTANIQNIIQPLPLPDDKLKQLEDFFSTHYAPLKGNLEPPTESDPLDTLDFPKKIRNLSGVPILIEKEINRILVERYGKFGVKYFRHKTQSAINRMLIDEGLIDEKLADLINEIRIICNNAIHGGDVTDEQYEFVKKIFPVLIATLREI